MPRARLLILADSGLATSLAEGLEGHGFRAETTAAHDAALALAQALGFDGAVVDRDVLGPRPNPILAKLAATLRGPICLLTRPTQRAVPAAVAFRLAKPVRLQALAAALHTALRANKAIRRLSAGRTGVETKFTETETHLLAMLERTEGHAVRREDLLRAVWGYNSRVSTRTLETHIYRLRQKLAHGPGRAKLLETVPGGYRLALRGKEVRK